MGCNIPRPSKRPPTPPIYEPPKMPKTAPAKMNDQPYGSKTNEAVEKKIQNDLFDAFAQFGQVAHDLTYHDTDLDLKIKERRTNCPNCCATITGPICEYCGTRFPDLESHYQILRTTDNQEIVIPIYVGGEKIDEVVRSNKTTFRSGNPAADVVAPPLPIKKQR